LGPQGIKAHLDKIEGAFSWDMWPTGPNDMTIGNDQAWKDALGSKSYMMGVSPWFFRSASGGKNWIWRGDDLWATRWAQTVDVAPQFVQIVTWNDYGESHYIGPIPDPSEIPTGSAPYVLSSPHESWRALLPYYISKYKGTAYTIVRDQMTFWYRDAPVSGGLLGDVVGNNANLGQTELPASNMVVDKIFFSALLTSPGNVQVQIGTNPAKTYPGVKGINHWNQAFNGQTGEPTFTVIRGGKSVVSTKGKKIGATSSLLGGLTNFNAWVGNI